MKEKIDKLDQIKAKTTAWKKIPETKSKDN